MGNSNLNSDVVFRLLDWLAVAASSVMNESAIPQFLDSLPLAARCCWKCRDCDRDLYSQYAESLAVTAQFHQCLLDKTDLE